MRFSLEDEDGVMPNRLGENAPDIAEPWFVRSVDFDLANMTLKIVVDFTARSRFARPPAAGLPGARRPGQALPAPSKEPLFLKGNSGVSA